MSYKNCKRTLDPAQPHRPIYVGTFEKWVDVGGRKRRFLLYVPEGLRACSAGVMVLGENGRTADDLLRDSAWKMIADTEEYREKLIIVYLEPEKNGWHIDEAYGTANGDVAYIDAVQAIAAERDLFCIHESKFYLFGVREGGTLAQMAAMFNPAVYAGVASVGGSAVSDTYMAACSSSACTNLDGFVDETARQHRTKASVPMPAWIIDDPAVADSSNPAVTAYWRRACGTDENIRQYAQDTVEYFRTKETEFPLDQDKAAYVVRSSAIAGASADDASLIARRVWKDFLFRQRRWMADPGGSLRKTEDPVSDLGMEYHYEEIDGWMREWYVHVPESVKRNPERPVPLVVAMHGYTCTGEIYVGNSGWNRVADQYGFIVIFPSALVGYDIIDGYAPLPGWNFLDTTPNGPDEVSFIRTIVQQTSEKYQVDASRIYATGHSYGSLMTQVLAVTSADMFTAAAPCSGVLFLQYREPMIKKYGFYDAAEAEMPIWMFGGEQEDWLFPAVPTNDNETGQTISIWRARNQIKPSVPNSWESDWNTHGRWNDLIYRRSDGALMVGYTWVDYVPHATMPEMSFRIWEEFFSKLSRVDGKIQYTN